MRPPRLLVTGPACICSAVAGCICSVVVGPAMAGRLPAVTGIPINLHTSRKQVTAHEVHAVSRSAAFNTLVSSGERGGEPVEGNRLAAQR
jgi:siroheme synthase